MNKLANVRMQCPDLELAKLASRSGIKLTIKCPDPYLGCRPENTQKTEAGYSSPSYIYISEGRLHNATDKTRKREDRHRGHRTSCFFAWVR